MQDELCAPPTPVGVLTARMKCGDEGAWREFHGRYFQRLLSYLLVLSRGQEDTARDALQATMIRAVRHIRRFETEDALWKWLAVLARTAFLDEVRRRRRYRSMLDRLFHRESALPADLDPFAGDRLMALLESNLASLPEKDRALLEQKYIARESVRAIAGVAGTTEKAVESRLVRLRRQLRTLMLDQLNKL